MNAVKEKKMAEWTPEEKNNLISNYGCELLVENATVEQIKDTSYPSDAYQVVYKVNGQVGSNNINIDLSSYNAGVYFYSVKVGNSVVTKKLVVQ